MKFRTVNSEAPGYRSPLFIVGCFEDEAPRAIPDGIVAGALARQARVEGFSGTCGATMVAFTDFPLAPERVLVVGLGPRDSFDLRAERKALTAAFRQVKSLKVASVTVAAEGLCGPQVSESLFGETLAVVAGLVDYVINHFKTARGGHKPEVHLKTVRVLTGAADQEAVHQGLSAGRAIAQAVNLARDLSNLPAGMLTPLKLAAAARRVAAASGGTIQAKVLRKPELEKLGAAALLAVSQGSSQEPCLIELTYTPPTGATAEVLGFVGKSITFDSGGLDLKTADGMRTMKRDMAGGASVLGAIGAVAALRLPISVKAVLAATENMPDGNSYKPGDVLNTLAGLTVEVDNTDAEGRLSLADAIEYAKRQGVTRVIDLATLTGSIREFSGDVGAGAFGNTPAYTREVLEAAAACGELLGELPMWEELRAANHTDIADLKNSGGSPGSVTAAWFLREFAGTTPWVHLDIAGSSYRTRELGMDPKGATGYGVRTLVELARLYSRRPASA